MSFISSWIDPCQLACLYSQSLSTKREAESMKIKKCRTVSKNVDSAEIERSPTLFTMQGQISKLKVLGSSIPILWLDKVGHCFRFFVTMAMMIIFSWSNIIHLVYTTTFITSFIWSCSRYLEWYQQLMLYSRHNLPQPIWQCENLLDTLCNHIEARHQQIWRQLDLWMYLAVISNFVNHYSSSTYQLCPKVKVSCRRCQHLASFPRFRDVPNQWLVRDLLEQYLAQHREEANLVRSWFLCFDQRFVACRWFQLTIEWYQLSLRFWMIVMLFWSCFPCWSMSSVWCSS